jgi:hypothetical protein
VLQNSKKIEENNKLKNWRKIIIKKIEKNLPENNQVLIGVQIFLLAVCESHLTSNIRFLMRVDYLIQWLRL